MNISPLKFKNPWFLSFIDRHWVGLNQFVMLMVLSSLFSPVSYLKMALQPYFKSGAMESPIGLTLSLIKLVVLMKAPGGAHVAAEIMPALLGCLLMMICVIALSQVLGRGMSHLLKDTGLVRLDTRLNHQTPMA